METSAKLAHENVRLPADTNLLARAPWAKFRRSDFASQTRPNQASPFAMSPLRSRQPGTSQRRVLVAEDDSAVRLLMQNWLQGWGYQVTIANNGAEAWKILQQEHSPELVIMDWMMPEIEGVELSRRLRLERRDYYQYILLITGKSEKQDIGHALESGADDYLVKPFGRQELSARLTVASRILSLQDHLIRASESLLDQATKDALTGLWNRAALLDLFQRELDRASRVKTPTGLLMLDLDRFKDVNDTYGHLTGDLVLKEIADRLRRAVRSYDLVGRYGGEEFLILFPDCGRHQLSKIAEKIRLSVASKPVVAGKVEIPVTLSIGATAMTSGGVTAADLMAVADVALYQAKSAGRNRTVYSESPWLEALQSNGTHHAFRGSGRLRAVPAASRPILRTNRLAGKKCG